ncbi:MAG TPA: protein translocase subunit SecF [Actinomycetes bacterium]|nr:protein translocase subunit SecF [Actinomycetes bacterium]
MSRLGNLGGRLYRGDVSYDFVGRQKRWYILSGIVLLIAIVSLMTKGLTLGIEFKGGAAFQLPKNSMSVEDARSAAGGIVADEVRVTEVSSPSGGKQVRVETAAISPVESTKVREALAKKAGVAVNQVSVQQIGPTWGEQITRKAVTALIVFLAGVAIFLALMFEWRMALAAIVTLFHDVLITVGIYSLVGFSVTPATVIGFLTILGYSLYDTVVVFDKVRENTRGLLGASRMTYSQAANLAINQTIVRSINTSVVALLPVGAILYISTALLGEGVLTDLSLALFIGIAVGTYSSIFIATPLLADLKEREPQYQQLARRVAARQGAAARAAKGTAATRIAPAPAAEAPPPAEEEITPTPVGAGASRGPVPRQQPKRSTGSRSGSKSKRRPSGKKRR